MNWVDVEQDVVLVDSTSGDSHVLSGAAAIVWHLLGGVTKTEVVDDVTHVFSLARERATADVEDAVSEMVSRGLAELCPAPGSHP